MALAGMLASKLHLHQRPKCGVVYDCDGKSCPRFQKGCDRCPFSLH
jgi:hypothetical protein